jgi:hypothetical protein
MTAYWVLSTRPVRMSIRSRACGVVAAPPARSSATPAAQRNGLRDSDRRRARRVSVSPELPIAAESAALNARASSYRSSGEMERLRDHRLDGRGHVVPVLAQQRRRLGDALGEQLLRRVAHVGRHPGDRLVEHAREGIDVAAPVEGTVARLLRAHVRRGPGDGPLLRDLLRGAVDRARDAEVGEHGVAAGEEDVLGLDVAMDHAALVRVRQRAGHLAPDPHRGLHGQPVVRAEPLAQRVALHVRHHVEELVVGLPRIVDREDVRVLQAGGELDLAHEALRAERVRQLGMQYLDRDEPLVAHVVREVYRGCTPTTDLPLQDVPSGEDVVQDRRDV